MLVQPEAVSKLQAAERQLRVAIRLFFNREDMIGIHTLTGAASQILRDLAAKSGESSPLRTAELIRPERRKEWHTALDRAKNFFKHADRDAEEVLDFYPCSTAWLLFEAVLIHVVITKAYLPETLVFISWINLKYPDILLEGPVKTIIQGALREGLDPDDFDLLRVALNLTSAEYARGNWPPKFRGRSADAGSG